MQSHDVRASVDLDSLAFLVHDWQVRLQLPAPVDKCNQVSGVER